MSPTVAVVGVGLHPFGHYPDRSLKDLARVAIVRAMLDADVRPRDIQAVYSANSMAGLLQGQEMIRGQTVLREVGIAGVPVVNVENACASGSSAFREALIAIRAGVCEVALAIGFEKMFVNDRTRSLEALESAADIEMIAGLGLQFTAIYALRLRRLLDQGKLLHRHLVEVSVKSHFNGSLNPYAQFRKPVTAEQVRTSRPIAEPLTLLMCTSISDGAAAVVLARSDTKAASRSPRVVVRASASISGSRPGSGTEVSVTTTCANAAYEQAAVGPEELDVLEVHDAMAPGELLYYEQLKLCEPGGAADLFDSRATALGGRLPVNPSGGLSSRGHPIAATGLAQIAELTWQLRGEAGARQVARPRFALAQNSGGWLDGEPAAMNIHILEREAGWP